MAEIKSDREKGAVEPRTVIEDLQPDERELPEAEVSKVKGGLGQTTLNRDGVEAQ